MLTTIMMKQRTKLVPNELYPSINELNSSHCCKIISMVYLFIPLQLCYSLHISWQWQDLRTNNHCRKLRNFNQIGASVGSNISLLVAGCNDVLLIGHLGRA